MTRSVHRLNCSDSHDTVSPDPEPTADSIAIVWHTRKKNDIYYVAITTFIFIQLKEVGLLHGDEISIVRKSLLTYVTGFAKGGLRRASKLLSLPIYNFAKAFDSKFS